MQRPIALTLLAALALTIAGCNPEPGTEPKPTPPVAEKPKIDVASGKYDPLKEPAAGEEVAVLDTEVGQMVLRFFDDAAPGHVKNFKDLVKKGFYDGTRFHRTIPGFMIQGGDPNSKDIAQAGLWGSGDAGYKIDAEFNPIPHKRGILSMARSQEPNTAGSQFFIVTTDHSDLDGNYTVFGAVVSGMEVADKIVETPTTDSNGTVVPEKAVKLKSVKLATWPLK